MAEFKPPKQERSDFHGKQSSTYKMDVQISHSIHPEVQKEDHIQQIQGKYRTDFERSMQVERGGDHRGESDGGSYSPAGEYSAEI